jgi:5-methyltetrahydrofolate--homocysteine methyltransferase
MSGLLVKSTVIMRENLEEMTQVGLDIPVLLGGAALTRKYVEEDCRQAYGPGRVAYARDAFDGLDLMAKVAAGEFDSYVQARALAPAPGHSNRIPQAGEASNRRPVDWEEVAHRRDELHHNIPVPTPPFWGARIIEHAPLRNLLPFLNENMLYQFHWGYRKQGRTIDEFKAWAAKELRPIAHRMLERCEKEGILKAQSAYGYWRAGSEGDQVVLFDETGTKELTRFAFPRQEREHGVCIADFYRPLENGVPHDVIGLQVATVGRKASEVANEWFKADKYQDYLYLHGLSVEMTEAMAEYTHQRIRTELGFAQYEAATMESVLKQGYRGSRYSFGYPACPRIEDQTSILALLGADKIGITLTEEFELEPEQSTSAIVSVHPQAKYFTL